jgi:GNAT superfamily N-acetyltransferase
MWHDIHPELDAEIKASMGMTRMWIEKRLSRGRIVGFVVRTKDGQVAGSCCLWIREEQPRPTSPRLEVPYLMSVYTERRFRRKGVAGQAVKSAIAWCREHGYESVILHASEEGKSLYEALGFKPTTEMRLKLNPRTTKTSECTNGVPFN